MKLITDKNILSVSVIISMYFTFLLLNTYVFMNKAVLIGVFQELLTIPMIIGQFIVLFLAIKKIIDPNTSNKYQLIYASILMLITIGTTFFCSFFI